MTKAKRTTRASHTFPPEFLQLLLKVFDSGQPIIVNTLGPDKGPYLNFRARVNEFRLAYSQEAEESGDKLRIEIANKLYGVTLKNPVKIDGQWTCEVSPRDAKLAEGLRGILGEEYGVGAPELEQPSGADKVQVRDVGAGVISNLYGTDDEDEDKE